MMRPRQHQGELEERAPVSPLWRNRRREAVPSLRLVRRGEEEDAKERLRSHARVDDLVHAVLVIALMIFIVVFTGSYAR